MKATLNRRYEFEASHRLPYVPEGHKCGRLHGHSYKVLVSVRGEVGSDGMVMDFAEIDRHAKPLIDRFEHRYINDEIPNPTSELMCFWFLRELMTSGLKGLHAVSVRETRRSLVRMTVKDAVELIKVNRRG